MKKEAILGAVVSIFFMILLFVYAPDTISLVFLILMCVIHVLGYIFGLWRLSRLSEALRYGRSSIQRARNVQTESAWLALKGEECVFGDDTLDEEFHDYCQRMEKLGENAPMILPVEAHINQEFIALHTWQNLVHQIPGTMTSLGILGTFLGLILGIDGMGFSSLNLAIESVENLLNGIELAFYTSIAGVILAVIFNLTYHVLLERSNQELELFLRDYHRHIHPSKDDALLQRQLEYMQLVTKHLQPSEEEDGEQK